MQPVCEYSKGFYAPDPVRRGASRRRSAPQCNAMQMQNSSVKAATAAPYCSVKCRNVPRRSAPRRAADPV